MTYSRGYRSLVYLTLLASFLVVVWGGIVRVSGSGLGCPDWPLCHGQFLPSLDTATRIEWTHRLLAGLGALSLLALASVTVARHRGDRHVSTLVLIAVPLYLLQAVLGAITVWLELPHTWVTLHLANAELLLATLTALAVQVRWPAHRRQEGAWTRLLFGAALGVFALLLSGAYVRGDEATAACAAWPLCSPADPFPVTGAPLVHMVHRYIAAAVGLAVLAACAEAWRRRRDIPGLGVLATLTAGLFALQVLIGALNPITRFSPWALGAHPAAASALWCAVVALAVVAWRPPFGARTTIRDVVALTKPAIMSLLLVTALGGMFLAARGVPSAPLVLAVLVGGALASGGASSLNHYFDRDIDQKMKRTASRPLPSHRVSPGLAIGVGVLFNVAAFVLLWLATNPLAAVLALSGTLFYIVIYTLWLKRTTTQNIVIGGAAGAFPPLVGYAAVSGSLDLAAWLLFAIIFFWTPAHFWALALLIRDDYARAGIPMLPVVKGDRATTWWILWYAASLVPLSVLLFVVHAVGVIYLLAALALGVIFVAYAVRLLRGTDATRRALAKSVYLYSLLYLALLFVAIMVDSAVRL